MKYIVIIVVIVIQCIGLWQSFLSLLCCFYISISSLSHFGLKTGSHFGLKLWPYSWWVRAVERYSSGLINSSPYHPLWNCSLDGFLSTSMFDLQHVELPPLQVLVLLSFEMRWPVQGRRCIPFLNTGIQGVCCVTNQIQLIQLPYT